MPSGMTASDLIKTSLRNINAIATGETPMSDELNDGLIMLNDLLENWSTQKLAVYGRQDVTFNTVVNTPSYTIGPTGVWVTDRPVRINDYPFCTLNGSDFPIQLIGQQDYDLITVKTQTQQIIERMLFVNDSPNGRITLWPTPSAIVPITMSIDKILSQVTLATVMSFPPGYLIAMRYQLGILLAPDYEVDLSQLWLDTAKKTFADIKRANKRRRTAEMDGMLMDLSHGYDPTIY